MSLPDLHPFSSRSGFSEVLGGNYDSTRSKMLYDRSATVFCFRPEWGKRLRFGQRQSRGAGPLMHVLTKPEESVRIHVYGVRGEV